MKIPLNLGQNASQSSSQAHAKILERDILAAQKGDWNAKNNIVRTFTPLLTSLASKRSSDVEKINDYIEAGKKGLFDAAKKYKQGTADRFNIFALNFIEKEMDAVDHGGGFFARLFGK
jgi:DNA-directed RNA polymerase specialized sigma subunit